MFYSHSFQNIQRKKKNELLQVRHHDYNPRYLRLFFEVVGDGPKWPFSRQNPGYLILYLIVFVIVLDLLCFSLFEKEDDRGTGMGNFSLVF